MKEEKCGFTPPAPEGRYLDLAFFAVCLVIPFFYLLLPLLLPESAILFPVRILLPPLAVLLTAGLVIFRISPEIPVRRKFGLPTGPFPWKTVFRYWLFMYVFLLLVSSAVRTLSDRFGLSLPEQDVVRILAESDAGGKILIVLSAVLIAPVTEELAFRHIFFSRAAYWAGGGTAAVLTAVLFSSLHGNLLQAPSLFFMSLILQAAYGKTGKLTVPVLIHSLFNSVSVILILLMRA